MITRRLSNLVPFVLLCLSVPAKGAVDDRLDRLVLPASETVHLNVDATRPRYEGRVEIDLIVVTTVDSFVLNALDLDLGHAELHDAAGPVEIVCIPSDHGRLLVRAVRPLIPGEARLVIEFENNFDTSGNALYRYEDAGRFFIASQFQAVAAREAFPCWDEPEFKIPWTVSVSVPEADLVVSSGPVEREERNGVSRTVHFRTTPPLPAYLLSLISGPYVTTPIEGLSVPGRIISVPDRDGLAREAARITPPILAALEEYFGSPYPFEKLDLIALPEFQSGAMENAAAITFSESILLVDPDNTTPTDRRFFVTTLVHEIAHMWFGDLVTMEWWNDLWLNESFATWMEDKLTDELFPEFNLDVVSREFAETAMNSDVRPSARPVGGRVNAHDNLDLLFDVFSYQKGGAVLDMIEEWIGDAAFRDGVRLFMKDYAWRSATAEDLWRCFGQVSGRPVHKVARSFIDQPGVPFVTASIEPDGRLRLSQRRFTPAGVDPGSQIWNIPLNLRFPGGSLGILMSSRDTLLSLPHNGTAADFSATGDPLAAAGGEVAWIFPNGGARGYCRWSVPEEALSRMPALPPGSLTPRERLELVFNLSALLEAGVLDGGRYLEALSRLGQDPESEVVLAVVEGLEKIRATFGGKYPAASFQALTREILGPPLDRIGFEPVPGEPVPVTLLRPRLILALGDLGDDASIRNRIRPGTESWLAGKGGLHPSLIDAGLALYAAAGSTGVLEAILGRLETETDPVDRQRLLEALGGCRSPEKVQFLLNYGLESTLRSSERVRLALRLSRQPGDDGRVFRWVAEHYEAFTAGLPAYRVAQLPELAVGCDVTRLPAVKAFFDPPAHRVEGTLTTLREVVDRIEQRTALRDREQESVSNWLVESGSPRSTGPRRPGSNAPPNSGRTGGQ